MSQWKFIGWLACWESSAVSLAPFLLFPSRKLRVCVAFLAVTRLLSAGTCTSSTTRSGRWIPAPSTPCHPSICCSWTPTCCGASPWACSPGSTCPGSTWGTTTSCSFLRQGCWNTWPDWSRSVLSLLFWAVGVRLFTEFPSSAERQQQREDYWIWSAALIRAAEVGIITQPLIQMSDKVAHRTTTWASGLHSLTGQPEPGRITPTLSPSRPDLQSAVPPHPCVSVPRLFWLHACYRLDLH